MPTTHLALLCSLAVGLGATNVGCADRTAQQAASSIEQAHGAAAWRAQSAIQFELVVSFGEMTLVDGAWVVTIPDGRARAQLRDGTLLLFDGKQAWVSPASSTFERARFHLRAWPYFLAASMKLRDSGTRLASLGSKTFRGKPGPALRLTFWPWAGDTPKDWYVVYADPATRRLRAMAYIVTYGTPVAEAAQRPHVIVYENFVTVDGVTLPTIWSMWDWDPEQGTTGSSVGVARVSNIQFVTPSPDTWTIPPDSRRDALPRS